MKHSVLCVHYMRVSIQRNARMYAVHNDAPFIFYSFNWFWLFFDNISPN